MPNDFQFQISVSVLRQRSIFLATPMYGGICSAAYTSSILNLQSSCLRHGIPFAYRFIGNESLITRGRNFLARNFLSSPCSHMLFVDSDIGFSASDAITMLAMMSDESDFDVVAGVYPTKQIDWNQVRRASTVPQSDLSKAGLRYVVDFGSQTIPTALRTPARVDHAGTGFMMIKRSTFSAIEAEFPENTFQDTDVHDFDQMNDTENRECHMFFQADIDQKSRKYISEDYWFCQKVAAAGKKVWVCPWMTLSHSGTYNFVGSYADQAR